MTREDAEREYISRVLYDNAVLLESKLTQAMFKAYGSIFASIQKLTASGTVTAMDLLYNLPEDKRHLVADMDSYTAIGWERYHDAVYHAWAKEQADNACKVAIGQRYPENVETLETAITELSLSDSGHKTVTVGDLLESTGQTILDRKKAGGKIPGLSWGLPLIDSATLGAQPGEFIFIGGRPGDGKSALGWQMARFQARSVKVGWISLEDTEQELMTRGIASEGKIDSRGLMTGDMDGNDLQKMRNGVLGMSQLRDSLYIHEHPGMGLTALQSEVRAMARRGCKIVYVDYVQIVKVPGNMTKHEQVSEVSRTLDDLAGKLKIPIVGLGQLKRPEIDRAPDLSSIQHSDQPGQDANQAWFIWHKSDKEGKLVESFIIIRKARNGSPRWVKVEFDGPTLTFREKMGQ